MLSDAGVYFVSVCDTVGGPMAVLTAATRFLLRVQDLIDQGVVRQKDLRAGNSEGWISMKMSGARGLSLNDAADIADALKIPLAELLRRPDDTIYELDNLEARLVESFRQLSPQERDAFLTIITMRHRQGTIPATRKGAVRPNLRAGGTPHERRALSSVSPEIHAKLAETHRDIEELEASEDTRRQAANTRTRSAKTASDRGSLRRPSPPANKG